MLSCSKSGNDEPANPTIDIPVPEIIVPDEMTETPTQVAFTTNVPWTLTLNDTKAIPIWFDVSPKSGGAGTHTLSVTITEKNPSYEDRVAYIDLKIGSVSKRITVTQKRKGALILTKNRYELEAKGGVIDVELKSNLDYSMTIPDTTFWITKAPNTKSLKKYDYQFDIAANPSRTARTGKVLFKDKESHLADTLLVTQAGNVSDTAEVNLPDGSSIYEIAAAIEKCVDDGFSHIRIHNELRGENYTGQTSKTYRKEAVVSLSERAAREIKFSFLEGIYTNKECPFVVRSSVFTGTLVFALYLDAKDTFTYLFLDLAKSKDISFFEFFAGRDYTTSQMNVQITGSQGTTHIEKDAIITNLTVVQGGIKIKGTVENLIVVDENTYPGTIRIMSGGKLGTVEKAGNYKFYWEVSNAEELKYVLSRKENNDGLFLMNDITGVDLKDGSVLALANDNYVFDGQGHSVTGSSPEGIFQITGKNVTIKNTKVFNTNRTAGASGVSALNAIGVVLDSLACNNSGVGLNVCNSHVTARRLFTEGNTQGGVEVSTVGSERASFNFAEGSIAEEYSVFAKTASLPHVTVKVPDTWHKYEMEDKTVWSPYTNDSLALVEIYHKNGFWDQNNIHHPSWDITKPISTWGSGVLLKNKRVTRVWLGPVQGDLDLTKLDCVEELGFADPSFIDGGDGLLLSVNMTGLKKVKKLICGATPELLNFNGMSSLEAIEIISGGGNRRISRLNLQGCSNLRKLVCPNQNLTSLDLKDCVQLDTLGCYGNQLTSLTINSPKLSVLGCGSNQLTSLNLVALPNLKHVDCGDNPFTSITLSELPNLTQLACGSCNQLTSINLSALPNLMYLEVAWNNKLPLLNVNNLPNLTRINCQGDTSLKSINVRGCSELVYITNVECYPNLQTIYADKNQVIALDQFNDNIQIIR